MALVVMAICISGPATAKDEIIVLRNVVLLDGEIEESESDVMIKVILDRFDETGNSESIATRILLMSN